MGKLIELLVLYVYSIRCVWGDEVVIPAHILKITDSYLIQRKKSIEKDLNDRIELDSKRVVELLTGTPSEEELNWAKE